jgi:DNA polymerase sigma
MGKMQPNILNKKRRKTFKKFDSSKKSKSSNIHSKRNKKKFMSYYLKSGFNSKKSSKKKFLENSSKKNKRNEEDSPINITNNNNISENNIFIFNNIYVNNLPKGRPDWMSEDTEKIEDKKLRFNKEIFEYMNYISPNNKSFSMRQTTVQILKQIITRKRPEWKVHLFGSFRQGTSTIFSDLDFEIIIDNTSSRKRDIDELFYLMKILRSNDFSNNIRLIRARVPILKATCTKTGISVDISVNRHNGYQAADLIKRIISRHKILKPMIIIIKILLKINNLNESHTGGMSSFLLFHLIYFFYIKYKKGEMNNPSNSTWAEKKPKAKINNEIFTEDSVDSDDYNESKSEESHKITKAVSFTEDDDSNLIHNGSSSSDSDIEQKSDSNDNEIGNMLKLPYSSNSTEEYNNIFDENMNRKESLDDYENINIVDFLLNFLNYYGLQFDYFEQGLKVLENDSCETYFKAERYNMDCSETISVESIQEPNVDIGKSCYKYDKIRMIFFETFNRIKEYMNDNKNSVLQALNFPSS